MSLDALSRATGLSSEQVTDVWERVKANGKLLGACSRHRFDVELYNRPFGGKWACSVCGGTVDSIARN
jgi:hypothetical protein